MIGLIIYYFSLHKNLMLLLKADMTLISRRQFSHQKSEASTSPNVISETIFRACDTFPNHTLKATLETDREPWQKRCGLVKREENASSVSRRSRPHFVLDC